jgi:hypothetical protein
MGYGFGGVFGIVMNSRRLIGSLSPRVTPYHIVVGMLRGASQQN